MTPFDLILWGIASGVSIGCVGLGSYIAFACAFAAYEHRREYIEKSRKAEELPAFLSSGSEDESNYGLQSREGQKIISEKHQALGRLKADLDLEKQANEPKGEK